MGVDRSYLCSRCGEGRALAWVDTFAPIGANSKMAATELRQCHLSFAAFASFATFLEIAISVVSIPAPCVRASRQISTMDGAKIAIEAKTHIRRHSNCDLVAV